MTNRVQMRGDARHVETKRGPSRDTHTHTPGLPGPVTCMCPSQVDSFDQTLSSLSSLGPQSGRCADKVIYKLCNYQLAKVRYAVATPIAYVRCNGTAGVCTLLRSRDSGWSLEDGRWRARIYESDTLPAYEQGALTPLFCRRVGLQWRFASNLYTGGGLV